jgi:hypothetical protein
MIHDEETTHEKATKERSAALAIGGALFLGAAGFFLWRDLALPSELVVLAVAVLASAAATLGWPRGWPPALGPAALLATTAGTGLLFLGTKAPGLLPALGVALVASIVALYRTDRRRRENAGVDLAHWLAWYAFGTALLAVTSALYFVFLTTGFATDAVARRLVPTILWLSLGLGLLIGADRRRPPATHVGMAFIAVAILKAVLYDSTHLAGGLRVAMLAAVGGLLVFAARTLGRSRRPARPLQDSPRATLTEKGA